MMQVSCVRRSLRWVGAAVFLVLFQILAVFALSVNSHDPMATYTRVAVPDEWRASPPEFGGVAGMYRRFNNWDAFHYLSIARYGYLRTADPSIDSIYHYRDNAAFFPGFPVIAGMVIRLLPVSPEIALVITAQALALLAWIYFFLLLKRWSPIGTSRARREDFVLWALVFPSSFYLVLPYSESTFIASLLGYAYFWERSVNDSSSPAVRRMVFYVLAALHGAVLGATRLVGVPLAVLVPILTAICLCQSPRVALATLGLAVPGALGFLSFLGHMQSSFGDWTWTFRINSVGWKNDFSLAGLWDWRTYLPVAGPGNSGHYISRWCVPLFFYLSGSWAVFFAFRERAYLRFKDPQVRRMIWITFSAWGAFATAFLGKVSQQSVGMVRYVLPCVMLYSICALAYPAWTPGGKFSSRPLFRRVAIGLLIVVQAHLIYRYVHGLWVT